MILADLIQGQFANINDLQLFYADQRPDAVGSNFTFVSVNGNFTNKISIVTYLMLFFAGGTNNQTPADAGDEANLDTQFAFGLSYPISVRISALSKFFDLMNLLSQLSFLLPGALHSYPMT